MAMCRLCLRTDKLQSVFDLDSSGNVAEVVKITCGVEIKATDRISQMICETCHKIALKMYKFRSISVKNNENLLAEFNASTKSSASLEPQCQPTVPIKCPKLLQKPMHSSIRKILKAYPNITLPRNMHLDHHFGPCITLLTTETSHWHAKKKRSLEQTSSGQNKKIKVSETKPESNLNKKTIPTLQELLRSIGTRKDKKGKKETVTPTKKINVLESILLGMSKPQSQKNIAENSVGNSVCSKKNFDNSLGQKNNVENCGSKENVPENIGLKTILENNDTKKNSASDENIVSNSVFQNNTNSAPEIINAVLTPPTQPDTSEVITVRSPRKTEDIQVIDDEQSSGSSDRLQIDLDRSNEKISREKSDFVKSLALVPASDPALISKASTSMDESLLLSHINKSQTLLSCKICNTWYCTNKQLKLHQKKIHTKCPFCGKKFRSLETKTEHDLYQCGKTCAQKIGVRLQLERVDENKEIVEKYPKAFGKNVDEDVESDVDVEGVDEDTTTQLNEVVEREDNPVNIEENVNAEKKNNVDLPNGDTASSTVKVVNTEKRRTSYVDNGLKLTLKQTDGRYVIVNDDCIYVSDDDDDDPVMNTPKVNRTINLHNNPILKRSSSEDSVSLLEKLLTEISTKENNNSVPNSYKFRIKDTTTKKCKLLKDHGELLKKGNIPVELSYGRDLAVGHKCVHSAVNYEPQHLWHNVPTVELNKSTGKVMATIRELRPKAGESSKVILNATSTTSATTTSTTSTKFQNTATAPVAPVVPTFDPTTITPGTSSYINYRIRTAAQGAGSTSALPKPPPATSSSSGYINLTINNSAQITASPPASHVYAFNPPMQNTSTPIAKPRTYILPKPGPSSTVTNPNPIPPLQPIASSSIPRILLTAPNTTATLPVTVRNFLLLPSSSQCVPLNNNNTEVAQTPSTSTVPVPPRSTIRVKNIIELS